MPSYSYLPWTQVLASFCEIATNSNPQETEFQQTIEEVNRFACDEVPHTTHTYATGPNPARRTSLQLGRIPLTYSSPLNNAQSCSPTHA